MLPGRDGEAAAAAVDYHQELAYPFEGNPGFRYLYFTTNLSLQRFVFLALMDSCNCGEPDVISVTSKPFPIHIRQFYSIQ